MSKKSLSVKTVSVLLVLVLMVGLAAGGTVAWLIDASEQVVNTFTYGDINITLTETDTQLDADNNPNTNSYKMIPGSTLTKDPVLTVKYGSEDAYLFVKLEKSGGTADYKFDDYLKYDINTGLWAQLKDAEGNDVEGIYYTLYHADQAAGDAAFPVLLNNQVTVLDSVTKEMVNALGEGASATYPKLTITGYAVQMENMETAFDAWKAVEAQGTTPDSDPTSTSTWDGSTVDDSWYDSAAPATAYTLDTAAEVAGLAELVKNNIDFTGVTVSLAADVDFADKEWNPIGDKEAGLYFNGTFDGGNKTIKGLKVSRGDYVSLFGAVKDATIKNLTVEGTVTGDNAAGIVARVEGASEISNCVNNVNVTGTIKAGGFAANVTKTNGKTVIKDCINNGDISCSNTAAGGVGGFVGYVNNDAELEITNCTNNGDITGTDNQTAGAIIGYAAGTSTGAINNVSNTGTITGKNYVGDGLNRYIVDDETVIAGYCATPANWTYTK